MNFTELSLKGAFLIKIEKTEDERGFFARSYCADEFEKQGLPKHFVQGNYSYNKKSGTLRGLHFQNHPYSEDKVVSCPRGKIFDVLVDLRKESKTYGKWHAEILSEDNLSALFIPKGFAHGFQTLEDNSLVCYLMSEFYKPSGEAGIRWDDPKLKIKWPDCKNRIISQRDRQLPYSTSRQMKMR